MLTEEQQFMLDLRGYVVLPGVLEDTLVKRLKDRIEVLENDPASLPPHERGVPGGPFAEAVCHSGNTWENKNHPRMALFYAYNHVNVRHHKPKFNPEVIAGLSEARQAFFREVYHPQFDTARFA